MSASSEHDPDSIMASIAAVKEILNNAGGGRGGGFGMYPASITNNDNNDVTTTNASSYWEDQINEIKQKRYEDIRKLKDQLDSSQDEIRRLKSDIQEANCESTKERSLRVSVEATNDTLNQHITELTNQISVLIKSKESLQEDITSLRSNQQTQKEKFSEQRNELESQIDEVKTKQNSTLKEIGVWEAKFLASQRANLELKTKLSKLDNSGTTKNASSNIEVIKLKRQHKQATGDLKKQLKEAQHGHKVALQAMGDLKKQLKETQNGHEVSLQKIFNLQRETENLKDAAGKLQTTTTTTTPGTAGSSRSEDMQTELQVAKECCLKARAEVRDQLKRLHEMEKQHRDLQNQLMKEQDAHKETRDKANELTKKLSHVEREMSEDEIEAEKEIEEQQIKKQTSLTQSYDKVSNHIGNIQTKISEGVVTQKLKNDLLIETSKMGALMESLQDTSKDKLKAAKVKADKLSVKLTSVRELWKAANEEVENAKVEYDKYASKIEQLQKDMESIEGGEKSKRRGSSGRGKSDSLASAPPPPNKRQKND